MDEEDQLRIEAWSLASAQPYRAMVSQAVEDITSQPSPAANGTILVARNNPAHHEVAILRTEDHHTLATTLPIQAQGVRVLGSPDTRQLGVAISYHPKHLSRIWRVDGAPASLQLVAELPGLVAGGKWLDSQGRLLGVTRIYDGASRLAAIDTHTGGITELTPGMSGATEQLLLADTQAGVLLTSNNATGRTQWAWRTLAAPHVIREATELNRLHGTVTPLAAAPTGCQFALHVQQGLRSKLLIASPDAQTLNDIPIPPGSVYGTGGWNHRGLWFPYSSSTTPIGFATVDPHTRGSWSLAGTSALASAPQPRAEVFNGAAGPVEALVLGPRDWRTAPNLILALHGGPESHWKDEFNPFLHDLAAAGATVVAPNQQGSTGYGTQHQNAIVGAWGGPDLADIIRMGQGIARDRRQAGLPPPALYGVSYGAYLALLATATEPHVWQCCLAIAPFSSPAVLHAMAGQNVKRLIDRLKGRNHINDDIGPRDLLRLVTHIRAPLMIMHGDQDPVIPVEQSRCIVAAARLNPKQSIIYEEVSGGGHYPLAEKAGRSLVPLAIQFLTNAKE
ncbi:alpha/beta hydrolase family protein [Streptomyces chartreusis]|uniref:alpha/beta hydrolase family protein n=1 Tax=Streptomyces chartreusis TaxID=1969 RepID=UPI0036CE426D